MDERLVELISPKELEEVMSIGLSNATKKLYLKSMTLLRRFFHPEDPESDEAFKKVVRANGIDIRKFYDHLLKLQTIDKRPYSPASIRAIWAGVHCIYAFLLRHQYIFFNPVDRAAIRLPKVSQRRKHFRSLTDQEVKFLFDKVDTRSPFGVRVYALLCLMFGGGLRCGECARLIMDDVQRTPAGTIAVRLRATKNGNDYLQTLPEWAGVGVLAWYQIRRLEQSLPHDSFMRAKRDYLYDLFKEYARKAGMPNISPHCARKTAIVKLIKDGVPFRNIQDFSRHYSITMVEAYDDSENGPEENPGKSLKYPGLGSRQFRLLDDLLPYESAEDFPVHPKDQDEKDGQ